MPSAKIHILYYDLREGPWGGANQFLKALRGRLRKRGLYSEEAERADVLLFNSYPSGSEHLFDRAIGIKRRSPDKVFILRLDGPFCLVRGRGRHLDGILRRFSRMLADGIVYQSSWSREQNRGLFGFETPYETVIHNAPDGGIFKPAGRKGGAAGRKMRLVFSSWSPNPRKGFELYRFLDENLDLGRYEMTFIGNSPIEFRNIRRLAPLPSTELAAELREHDIFVTASSCDPCSNSLVEAQSCGLPIVALADGGHPELVGEGGELFRGEEDIIEKVEKVAGDYEHYRGRLPERSIDRAAREYSAFAESIVEDARAGRYHPKAPASALSAWALKMRIRGLGTIDRIRRVCGALKGRTG